MITTLSFPPFLLSVILFVICKIQYNVTDDKRIRRLKYSPVLMEHFSIWR